MYSQFTIQQGSTRPLVPRISFEEVNDNQKNPSISKSESSMADYWSNEVETLSMKRVCERPVNQEQPCGDQTMESEAGTIPGRQSRKAASLMTCETSMVSMCRVAMASTKLCSGVVGVRASSY